MDPDSPLYENQYIGTFIYALGIISGRNGLDGIESFNLLQQTPMDARFGDLVSTWQGSSFVIEFKRDQTKLRDELGKASRAWLFRRLEAGRNHGHVDGARTLMDRCHFVAYAIPPFNAGIAQLVFSPYSRLLEVHDTPDVVSDQGLSKKWSLREFVGKLLAERGRPEEQRRFGASVDEIRTYLEALTRKAALAESSGGSASTGGLIVNIDKDGLPKLVRFNDLLGLERKQSIERRGPERSRGRDQGGPERC
jgi:hypothetical protein